MPRGVEESNTRTGSAGHTNRFMKDEGKEGKNEKERDIRRGSQDARMARCILQGVRKLPLECGYMNARASETTMEHTLDNPEIPESV